MSNNTCIEKAAAFALEASWQAALKKELSKPYLLQLAAFLSEERAQELAGGSPVYPPEPLVFSAFSQTPFPDVKVVLVGQDPYHGPGQANGMCFSVSRGIKPPPSLKNIFKELKTDLDISPPAHGCLISWAKQGVLLLNSALTVRKASPRSHSGNGWEQFTDAVIARLALRDDPVIFLLWGRLAQEKIGRVLPSKEASRHFVLTAAHPCPYSARTGFFGCRHFSKANEVLQRLGKSPINWGIGLEPLC